MLSLVAESDSEGRTLHSKTMRATITSSLSSECSSFRQLWVQRGSGGWTHRVSRVCTPLVGHIKKVNRTGYTMGLGVVLAAPGDSPVLTDRSPIPEPCFRSIHFQLWSWGLESWIWASEAKSLHEIDYQDTYLTVMGLFCAFIMVRVLKLSPVTSLCCFHRLCWRPVSFPYTNNQIPRIKNFGDP